MRPKNNLKIVFLRKYFIILLFAISFVSCVSSKWYFLDQKCEGITVKQLLESNLNYLAIARENNIEGLIKIELKYDTIFHIKPLYSHLKVGEYSIGAEQKIFIEILLCQCLSKNLNRMEKCQMPKSSQEVIILYKMINSSFDISTHKYDILIQTDTVEIIEIDNY
ncbi:MAG: hypothetical protein IPN29_02690 [Saprospiraceae bacterium]|nr:hypothetical protein [Saprospiraceae bacterium]